MRHLSFLPLYILMAALLFIAPPRIHSAPHRVEATGQVRTRGLPNENDKRQAREKALRDAYKQIGLSLAQTEVQKKVFLDRLGEMTLEDLEFGTSSMEVLRETPQRRGNYLIGLMVTIKEGFIEGMLEEAQTENLDRMRMRRIMVVIPEVHIQRPVPDPAGETEMIRILLEEGFRVVDQKQVALIRESDAVKAAVEGASQEELVRIAQSQGADYLIYGEAFSHEIQPDIDIGSLSACRARVEARMVRTDTGEILVADGKEAGASDMSDLVAGKKALREAATELATVFVAQLMKRAEIEGSEEFITLVIAGADFRAKEAIKGLLQDTPEVIEVREVEFQSERATLEVIADTGAGSLAGLVYTAAVNEGLNFDIMEQTAARIVGRLVKQEVASIIEEVGDSYIEKPPAKPRPPQSAGSLDDGELADVSAQRWVALLIGIDDYSSSGGNIASLETPGSDVHGLAEVLRNEYRFDVVRTILDRDATLRGLREAFDSLGATLQPDDNVLIYYAGHGHLQKNTDVGLWITADATDSLDGLYNAEIKAYIAKMPARRVLLISDSCYSGDFLRRAVGRVQYEDLVTEEVESVEISAALARNPMPSREVITSGNLHPVPDKGSGFCSGHSPFACALINALQDAPKGAALSTNDLYYHVSLFLDSEEARQSGSNPQKGTLPEHRGGEFFLVRFR